MASPGCLDHFSVKFNYWPLVSSRFSLSQRWKWRVFHQLCLSQGLEPSRCGCYCHWRHHLCGQLQTISHFTLDSDQQPPLEFQARSILPISRLSKRLRCSREFRLHRLWRCKCFSNDTHPHHTSITQAWTRLQRLKSSFFFRPNCQYLTIHKRILPRCSAVPRNIVSKYRGPQSPLLPMGSHVSR